MLNVDGYKNINKAIHKRPSQPIMVTFLKHYKIHCINVYVGVLLWSKKVIFSNNDKILIECYYTMFSIKHFKNIL